MSERSREKELKEWAVKAARSSIPKMKESAIMVGIATGSYLEDPLCALQIGYALFLDKPIFLIVGHEQKLPKALVRVAAHIERADLSDQADLERATKAIAQFADIYVKDKEGKYEDAD